METLVCVFDRFINNTLQIELQIFTLYIHEFTLKSSICIQFIKRSRTNQPIVPYRRGLFTNERNERKQMNVNKGRGLTYLSATTLSTAETSFKYVRRAGHVFVLSGSPRAVRASGTPLVSVNPHPLASGP